MPTEIKIPNCGHHFQMEEAVTEEYKQELRKKMEEFVRGKEQEYRNKTDEFAKKEQQLEQMAQQKEAEISKKFIEEKARLQQSLEENLRKTIASDFENKLRMLEQNNKDNEEKLKDA